MRMRNFWAQNGPFPQMRIFFFFFFLRKPVNEPCFFYSCLSACQKSKSDINLLVKYWRLKKTEISLAKSLFWLTWEPDFSQACSIPRMLVNHKNCHFTQIPDKTNDMIFFKSQKQCFWAIFDHFWSFLPDGDFFHKFQLCHRHLSIYGPLTPC